MYPDIIFTLDARENGLLESMKEILKLSTQELYMEIRGSFHTLIDNLNNKNINYALLKNALIPTADRKEIALAFDTLQIETSAYGTEVFLKILPLLERDATCSCLCGDYIGSNKIQSFLRSIFFEEINGINSTTYRNSDQYFIVYFNNLSDRQFETLIEGLLEYKPFTGFFDMSFASPIKTVLSTQLIRLFIKNKLTILLSSEENLDGNSTMYPFEELGYKCLGIDSITYGLFLSYKIEREEFPGFESDISFSINAISKNVLDINDFTLVIEQKKLEYLLDKKFDNLERANFHILSETELADIIRNKLKDNYIYNLTYLAKFNTMKFNIMLEVPRIDKKHPMKLTAALEYIDTTKELRLITMF